MELTDLETVVLGMNREEGRGLSRQRNSLGGGGGGGKLEVREKMTCFMKQKQGGLLDAEVQGERSEGSQRAVRASLRQELLWVGLLLPT